MQHNMITDYPNRMIDYLRNLPKNVCLVDINVQSSDVFPFVAKKSECYGPTCFRFFNEGIMHTVLVTVADTYEMHG